MSLQVWLPLTGDTRNQGLSGVTPTNNGATVDDNGKLGKCYSFNGSSTITTNYICPSTSNWSVACWVKPSFNSGTICRSADNKGPVIDFYTSGSSLKIRGFVWYSSSSYYMIDYTLPSYSDWIHIVLTQGSGKLTLYINGIFIQSVAADNSLYTTDGLVLGYGSGYGYLNGQLNDFRFYNNTLSESEIKELARGLMLHYPLNNRGFGQENIIPNTTGAVVNYSYPTSGYKDQFAQLTTKIPTASQYVLSFWAKSTVNGDKIRSHFYSPNTTTTCASSQGITKTASDGNMDFTLSTQWDYYWVVYTQTETTAVKHVIIPRMGAVGNTSGVVSGTGTVSIRGVKLEEGSTPTPWCPNSSDALATTLGLNGTIEYDISGFQNNGTKTGTFAYTSDTPKYDVSTNFPATGNNYINIGTQLYTMRDEMTVSIWCKADDWTSTSKGVPFSSVQGGGFGWQANNANYTFYCGTGASSNTYVSSTVSVSGLSAGWHMLSATYDGLALRVYTDGVLTNTVTKYTTKTPLYYNNNSAMFVSGESAGSLTAPSGSIFRGSLSDLRVYATALSAEDIAQLYSENKLT